MDSVDTRLDRRVGTPGSGWHWGKYLACKPACLANVSSGVIGSWAQSWKILLAYGSCECYILDDHERDMCTRTSGWGRPCSWALIDQGRLGFPYIWSTSLVIWVYRSSESIKRPSMSKRHARMRGVLAFILTEWPPVLNSELYVLLFQRHGGLLSIYNL